MQKKVIIAGAGDALGSRLTAAFLEEGWFVYAGYCSEDERREPGENLSVFGIDPRDHFYIKAAQKKVGEPVDLLIVNIDKEFGNKNATILDDMDYGSLMEAYDYNCLGPLRIINVFLPLLEKGEGKRICVVTSKESSNNQCDAADNFAAHISKAPLNMALTQLFGGLRPEGYTFRLYCKDQENGHDEWAMDYFLRDRSYEPEDLKHSDEERIVMRDWMAKEVPW